MITTDGLNFLKEINGTLTWEKIGNLGTLYVDEISDFYIKANLIPNVENLKYKISSGSLPAGLNLISDGIIQGKVWNDLILSGITTQTFNFTAQAYINYDNIISQENFSLTVTRTTSTKYTSIFSIPLLNLEKRKEINSFLNDPEIFDKKLIYRPTDINFGVQKELKLTIEFSSERVEKQDYYEKLNENFSRRKVVLGDLKVSSYIKNKSTIYDLIYIEVIDNLINKKGVSLPDSILFNGENIFPPGIINMKNRIKSNFQTSYNQIPSFFKTENITFKMFVPLCYCLPNKSKLILSKIKNKSIKFNNIDFDIDRLIIDKLSETITINNINKDMSAYYRFKT